MEDPQQRQMNVYARFIDDDAQDETTAASTTETPPPAQPARRAGAQPAKAGARSAKPGVKKRGVLPK